MAKTSSSFEVASITGDTLTAVDARDVQGFNPGDRVAFHNGAGQKRHVDLYGGDFVIVKETNWSTGTVTLLQGQAACVGALCRGDVCVKYQEPEVSMGGFHSMPSKAPAPIDYDMLEELRRWMISAEVTKVTVHGITLELGETAFWGNESDSKANREPKSPPEAPWDTLDEHETPQQRIRREHEAALGRTEPKDSVS